jgi:hypothetical protein
MVVAALLTLMEKSGVLPLFAQDGKRRERFFATAAPSLLGRLSTKNL